jgi:hypothetical protein
MLQHSFGYIVSPMKVVFIPSEKKAGLHTIHLVIFVIHFLNSILEQAVNDTSEMTLDE